MLARSNGKHGMISKVIVVVLSLLFYPATDSKRLFPVFKVGKKKRIANTSSCLLTVRLAVGGCYILFSFGQSSSALLFISEQETRAKQKG